VRHRVRNRKIRNETEKRKDSVPEERPAAKEEDKGGREIWGVKGRVRKKEPAKKEITNHPSCIGSGGLFRGATENAPNIYFPPKAAPLAAALDQRTHCWEQTSSCPKGANTKNRKPRLIKRRARSGAAGGFNFYVGTMEKNERFGKPMRRKWQKTKSL